MVQIVGRLANPVGAAAVAAKMDEHYRAGACARTQARSGDGTGAVVGSGIALASIAHGISSSKFDVPAMFGRLLLELLGCAAISVPCRPACANLGTLLLARAAARERELAVRLSLGASRRRLAVQMLVESSVLATIGTMAGLLLAALALRLIAHHLPGPIVERAALHLNGAVLGFTAAVAVAAVLLFGGVPARRATRTNLIGGLNLGGRTSAARRGGGRLIGVWSVAQVVIALVLVEWPTGLFVATLRNLREVDGGFATSRIVSTDLDARAHVVRKHRPDPPRRSISLARAAATPRRAIGSNLGGGARLRRSPARGGHRRRGLHAEPGRTHGQLAQSGDSGILWKRSVSACIRACALLVQRRGGRAAGGDRQRGVCAPVHARAESAWG